MVRIFNHVIDKRITCKIFVLMCQRRSLMNGSARYRRTTSLETLAYTNMRTQCKPLKTFSCDRDHFRFWRALPLADFIRSANWVPHKHRKPVGHSLHKERKTKRAGSLSLPPHARMPRSRILGHGQTTCVPHHEQRTGEAGGCALRTPTGPIAITAFTKRCASLTDMRTAD